MKEIRIEITDMNGAILIRDGEIINTTPAVIYIGITEYKKTPVHPMESKEV